MSVFADHRGPALNNLVGLLMLKSLLWHKKAYLAFSRSFLVCLGVALGVPEAAALAGEIKSRLTVSMHVRPMVQLHILDTPEDTSGSVFTVGGNCGAAGPVCLQGQGVVDFAMVGNTKVRARVRPIGEQQQRVNSRRLGVFDNLTHPGVDAPKIFYDVFFRMTKMENGFEGLGPNPVVSPTQIQLNEYTQSSETWTKFTNLEKHARLGRIYVQPLFNNSGSFEDTQLPLTGTYQASLEITVIPR